MAITYKVHPSIGVARVGDSDEHYLCPETAGGLPLLPDGRLQLRRAGPVPAPRACAERPCPDRKRVLTTIGATISTSDTPETLIRLTSFTLPSSTFIPHPY